MIKVCATASLLLSLSFVRLLSSPDLGLDRLHIVICGVEEKRSDQINLTLPSCTLPNLTWVHFPLPR
jgi:hypothetical protein